MFVFFSESSITSCDLSSLTMENGKVHDPKPSRSLKLHKKVRFDSKVHHVSFARKGGVVRWRKHARMKHMDLKLPKVAVAGYKLPNGTSCESEGGQCARLIPAEDVLQCTRTTPVSHQRGKAPSGYSLDAGTVYHVSSEESSAQHLSSSIVEALGSPKLSSSRQNKHRGASDLSGGSQLKESKETSSDNLNLGGKGIKDEPTEQHGPELNVRSAGEDAEKSAKKKKKRKHSSDRTGKHKDSNKVHKSTTENDALLHLPQLHEPPLKKQKLASKEKEEEEGKEVVSEKRAESVEETASLNAVTEEEQLSSASGTTESIFEFSVPETHSCALMSPDELTYAVKLSETIDKITGEKQKKKKKKKR